MNVYTGIAVQIRETMALTTAVSAPVRQNAVKAMKLEFSTTVLALIHDQSPRALMFYSFESSAFLSSMTMTNLSKVSKFSTCSTNSSLDGATAISLRPASINIR